MPLIVCNWLYKYIFSGKQVSKYNIAELLSVSNIAGNVRIPHTLQSL